METVIQFTVNPEWKIYVYSWRMLVLYLCTSSGCSDRAEHLEIVAIAAEIIVVCIATHNSIKHTTVCDGADLQKFSYLSHL